MKTAFTKNTKEVRLFLEQQRFQPLSFFQGKEFIYPMISTWANSKSTWHENDYATLNDIEKKDYPFLEKEACDFDEFKSYIISIVDKNS